jgi:deoxyribonuclease (pyrimidine dimer)
MTRINAGVEPRELHRRHLIAEYREIPMVPAALRRSLRTRLPEGVLRSVPPVFTLNKGHVTFFYDKLGYLQSRYDALVSEMLLRGYVPDPSRVLDLSGIPPTFYGNWQETPAARTLILERIAQRQAEKPHLYLTLSASAACLSRQST